VRFHGVNLGAHLFHAGLDTLKRLVNVVQPFSEPRSRFCVPLVSLRPACYDVYRRNCLSQWSPHLPDNTCQ